MKPKLRRAELRQAEAVARKALLIKPTGLVSSKRTLVAGSTATVSPVLCVGALVKASDRDNYGYVLSVRPGAVEVHFRNPESGSTATVEFKAFELTVVR